MAVAHYLEALAWQREVVQIARHFRRQEPPSEFPRRRHCGAAQRRPGTAGDGTAATTVNIVTLNKFARIIKSMRAFVDQVYVPDTLAIAGFYTTGSRAARAWATS